MSEEIVLEVVQEVVADESIELVFDASPDLEEVDKSQIMLEEPIVRSINIKSFHLRIMEVALGQSVRVGVMLSGERGDGRAFQDYKEIVISGDEYLAWGADDNYIVELMKTKIPTML